MAKQKKRPLSRREARELDVEIGFLEGLVRRDPAYTDALEVLGDDYTSRGRIGDCLKVDEQLRQLRPADPNVRFNLACTLALSGQADLACAELDQALDLGFRDFGSVRLEPDLAAARKHPAFKRIRERIRRLEATPKEH
jgi:tetratricopeptide (TPR) repeat protein